MGVRACYALLYRVKKCPILGRFRFLSFISFHRFLQIFIYLWHFCDTQNAPFHSNADACGLPPVAALCALLCRFPCPFVQFCATGQKGKFGRFSALCGFKGFPCITASSGAGGAMSALLCSTYCILYIIGAAGKRKRRDAARHVSNHLKSDMSNDNALQIV